MSKRVFLVLLACLATIQCAPRYRDGSKTAAGSVVVAGARVPGGAQAVQQALGRSIGTLGPVDVINPSEGAEIPPDLAPPVLEWRDADYRARYWALTLPAGGGKEIVVVTDRTLFSPDEDLWERVRQVVGSASFRIMIHGLTKELEPVSRGAVTLRISRDPVQAALMYLEMPLPFSYGEKHPETFRWRLADLRRPEPPRTLVQGLPACSNCHSLSRDGRLLGFDLDLDGDKGGYVLSSTSEQMTVSRSEMISWNRLEGPSGRQSMGLFSRISPDKKLVASTVWERSFFAFLDDIWYSQFFFPIEGSIGIYDIEKGSFSSLSGADDEDLVQTCPDWHPDGQSLVFARARPEASLFSALGDRKVLPTAPSDRIQDLNKVFQLQFDLYRIPFAGGRGGLPTPLKGASGNGSSNYFPRHSPDGSWIVFTRSPNGLAIQPQSELWIVPASGGDARRLQCNLSPMNSWHSWSPNGRWLAFSSKARGPYTRIYLAHVDDKGAASPPVMLARLHSPGYACVVPELCPPSVLDIRSIRLGRDMADTKRP